MVGGKFYLSPDGRQPEEPVLAVRFPVPAEITEWVSRPAPADSSSSPRSKSVRSITDS